MLWWNGCGFFLGGFSFSPFLIPRACVFPFHERLCAVAFRRRVLYGHPLFVLLRFRRILPFLKCALAAGSRSFIELGLDDDDTGVRTGKEYYYKLWVLFSTVIAVLCSKSKLFIYDNIITTFPVKCIKNVLKITLYDHSLSIEPLITHQPSAFMDRLFMSVNFNRLLQGVLPFYLAISRSAV